MHRRAHWAFECLDLEEAVALMEGAPEGSHVEVKSKPAGDLVILWVPVASDLLDSLLNGHREPS